MSTHHFSILILAPACIVFEHLTNPALTCEWQFGKVLITTWNPGCEIRFSTEFEGKISVQCGTVLEFNRDKKIKYSLYTQRPDLEDKIENYNITTYLLKEENEGTRVEIIQEDNRPNGFTGSTLMPILNALKQAVQK